MFISQDSKVLEYHWKSRRQYFHQFHFRRGSEQVAQGMNIHKPILHHFILQCIVFMTKSLVLTVWYIIETHLGLEHYFSLVKRIHEKILQLNKRKIRNAKETFQFFVLRRRQLKIKSRGRIMKCRECFCEKKTERGLAETQQMSFLRVWKIRKRE